MHTITEAAKELNVSRKKIYNYILKLDIVTVKNSEGNYIKDNDYDKLKAAVLSSVQERARNVIERDRNMVGDNISDREYMDLKERIRFLQDQLLIKDQQIKDKDFQISGLIQTNINITKALNPTNTDYKYISVGKKPSFFNRFFRKNNKNSQ